MFGIDLENVETQRCLKHGINVHNLKAGTLILVITKNSMYKIIKGSKDQHDITIHGGKRFLEPVEASFSGSTFGGSMMKLGWIGYMMHMEIYVPSYKKMFKTTGVRAARIVGSGWEYDMEWTEKRSESNDSPLFHQDG